MHIILNIFIVDSKTTQDNDFILISNTNNSNGNINY